MNCYDLVVRPEILRGHNNKEYTRFIEVCPKCYKEWRSGNG